MTSREIVRRAIGKARADIQNDLEEQELWYGHSKTVVDDELVESFDENCLTHLTRLMTHHCKSRKTADAVSGHTSSRGYQIGRIPGGYVVCIGRNCSSVISYLPDNIDEVLEEYCRMRQSFRDIVQEELLDYRSGIMAGKIIGTSIEFKAGDLLSFYNMTIKVVCQEDGAWKCTLTSTMFEASITFFSDALHIREDIERCSEQLYQLDW